jgi:adenylyl-sulfate kinase
MQKGLCVWFTGLPCAGKSTLALKLSEHLTDRGTKVVVFDGDVVRRSSSADLGYTADDRHANVVRVATSARDAIEDGSIAICALISPYARSREEARRVVGAPRFIEVYVNTPAEVCEARDSKGMYRLARAGKLTAFTGVSDPYEAPGDADITVVALGDPTEVVLQIAQELDRRLTAS